MHRTGMAFLTEWLVSSSRKPLVIRGARQVGKTWLVRKLAKDRKRVLIEINLEKRPQLLSLFASNNPQQIVLNLSAAFNESIDPSRCILFLDEIQAAPELLAKLRWLAEDMPELPVIAAGSLLEFVLAQHSFSMPVGRINYMYLEPLSFEEFLQASNKPLLAEYISAFQWGNDIPREIHEQLMVFFKEYCIIGGMPQAVDNWTNKRSLKEVSQVHHDLMATYRDDFAKYSGRMSTQRLDEVMMAVPLYLGQKFVYSKVNPSVQSPAIKQSLDLLFKARVCHRVVGCAANGIPLAAEIQDKYMKVIFLDVGLCSTALGLSLDQLNVTDEIDLVNKGGIAEQVVGQILRTIDPFYVEPALYYWHREEKGSNAEIDYVIQHRNHVIPVEVKAGSTGSLKSLHLFMGMKQFSRAVRINSDLPSQTAIDVMVPGLRPAPGFGGQAGRSLLSLPKGHHDRGNRVQYTLFSIPFYLMSRLHNLLP